MAILSVSILSLMVALDQGAAWGWQSQPTLALALALVGVSLLLLILFPLDKSQLKVP